jgi:hypothetical protein
MKLSLIFALASVTFAAPVATDTQEVSPPPRLGRPGLGQQVNAFRTPIWYDAPIAALHAEINTATPGLCFI